MWNTDYSLERGSAIKRLGITGLVPQLVPGGISEALGLGQSNIQGIFCLLFTMKKVFVNFSAAVYFISWFSAVWTAYIIFSNYLHFSPSRHSCSVSVGGQCWQEKRLIVIGMLQGWSSDFLDCFVVQSEVLLLIPNACDSKRKAESLRTILVSKISIVIFTSQV